MQTKTTHLNNFDGLAGLAWAWAWPWPGLGLGLGWLGGASFARPWLGPGWDWAGLAGPRLGWAGLNWTGCAGLSKLGPVLARAWPGDGVCYLEDYLVLSGNNGFAGWGWLGDGLGYLSMLGLVLAWAA